MIDAIFSILTEFVIGVIENIGVMGVFFLMLAESAAIPIPSEIIMPFSGFLVFEGKFTFLSVVLAGVLGNIVGSVILYYVGYFGGRPFLEKYGKYFLFTHHDLEVTERWFKKYGDMAVLLSRMLPVVRTFISFVPGVTRMNIFKFVGYTAVGCIPWVFVLTYAGLIAGQQWDILHPYFKKVDWLILIILVIGVMFFIKKHLKNKNTDTGLNS